jgi:hypothetical protein
VIGLIAAIAMPVLIWASNVIWAHKYIKVGTEKDKRAKGKKGVNTKLISRKRLLHLMVMMKRRNLLVRVKKLLLLSVDLAQLNE